MLSHPGALLQMRSEVQTGLNEFDVLIERVGHQFGRVEARQRMIEHV